MDINFNEITEKDFNSTLLVDGTTFSSHTVNTLFDLQTTSTTNVYENHRHRQPVNSTELTQNSDLLNTTHLPLSNVNSPLLRLQR